MSGRAWIQNIDRIAALNAKTIVAGHKRSEVSDDEVVTMVDRTRGYIRDFRDAVAASTTADEVVEAMTAKYGVCEVMGCRASTFVTISEQAAELPRSGSLR